MNRFRIHAVPGDGKCSLVLEGEIDVDAAPDVVALGVASLGQADIEVLTVDLAQVTFIDSTAIGALILLRNTATESGKHLVVTRVPMRVRKVMAITGLDAVFEITTDTPLGTAIA